MRGTILYKLVALLKSIKSNNDNSKNTQKKTIHVAKKNANGSNAQSFPAP